jgi:hypothetical protein
MLCGGGFPVVGCARYLEVTILGKEINYGIVNIMHAWRRSLLVDLDKL